MFIRKFLSTLSATLVLLSCQEKDEKPVLPLNQLKIYVHEYYTSQGDRTYVLIHDHDGKVSDYQEVLNGDTLKLNLSSSTNHHLTIYNSGQENTGHYSSLKTFMNVPVDVVLILGLSEHTIETPSELGNELEVIATSEDNEIQSGSISNAAGNFQLFSNISGNQMNLKINRRIGFDEHLIFVSDKSGKPYYKFFFQKEGQTLYPFNLSEFKDFEYELVLENTGLKFNTVIVQEMIGKGNSFTGSFLHYSSTFNPDKIILGYLEGFPLHHTFLSANPESSTNQSVNIIARSVKPPQLDLAIPQPLAVVDKDFYNFSFKLPEYYERWSGNWLIKDSNNSPLLRWTISGNEQKNPQLELPQELISQNPRLQELNKLELSSLSIIKGKFNYSEWLENELVKKNTPYEFQEITWRETF
ncbi:hypothetical protein [Algoriphagus sp. NG3]|uniref:hypothetical protein n=1 Tax=Algoriphagus sp. NG3 TaxID=3097546 RepID=UPI002A7ED869|nr:hypothetical protein [Algoriphagus sp. NG3]WPR77470.1 hypothetical protein SLW71_08930 [Algoriphagus sp. NG3]